MGSPGQWGVVFKHHQKFHFYSSTLFSVWTSLPRLVSFCQALWAHVFLDLPSQRTKKEKPLLISLHRTILDKFWVHCPGPGHLCTPQSSGCWEENVVSDDQMFPYIDHTFWPWRSNNCGTISDHVFEKESGSHFSKVGRKIFPEERRDSEEIKYH